MKPNILIVLVIAAALVATPVLVYASTNLNSSKSNIQETQAVATQHLTDDEKQINGVTFTPRWSPAIGVAANSVDILFADCKPNEFAVSGQHMFETGDLQALNSFSLALPDNTMTWLTIVENTANSEKAASGGVICASDSGVDTDGVDLDDATRTTIHNTVKQFIKVENNQIVNLNQIINVYQNITQNAIQIVNITGNNNTVTQIINQSATQIVASNGTNIGQTINQTAQQQAAALVPEEEAPPVEQNATTPATTEEEETPTLPIDETSAQPVQAPTEEETTTETPPPPPTTTEEETTEEEETATPPVTEEETTEETTTETTTEEPTSQIEENEENPEEVVE
jgi:hypothetical protein